MNRVLAGSVMACIVIGPAAAADATIEAAIKTFDQVSADPEKLKTYCAMSKAIDAAGDDEKKADAASETFLKQLGPEFESAWDLDDAVDDDSADGKALSAALDRLDASCPESP